MPAGTVLALLTFLYVVYSSERDRTIAGKQLEVAEQQLEVTRRADESISLSLQDVRRVAEELHRLQAEAQIKPPPKSTRGKKPGKAKPKR